VHGYATPEQQPLIEQAEHWRDRLIRDGTARPGHAFERSPCSELQVRCLIAAPARLALMNGRKIASMCWTLLTLGLSTGTVVLWRGGSTHNDGLKIGGTLLLIAAVIVAALAG